MNLKIVISYFLIYFVWGANYIAIYYAIKGIPPFTMIGSRFLIAGLILFAIDFGRNKKWPSIKESRVAIIQGFFLNLLGTTSLVWSEQYVPTGMASILVASVPIWILFVDYRNWKTNFRKSKMLAGLVLGVAGVGLISFDGQSRADWVTSSEFIIGLIVILLGTVSWAYGAIYIKNASQSGSLLMNVAVQLLFAGIIQLLIGVLVGEQPHVENVVWETYLSMIHLIILSSLFGYTAYTWLLRNRPATEVATHTFVNPVFAVFLGIFMLDEKMSSSIILSLIMILSAVFLIRYKE